jgi:hypothetical protein
MSEVPEVKKLAQAIRALAVSGLPEPEKNIESYLNEQFHGIDLQARLRFLQALAQEFGGMQLRSKAWDVGPEFGDIHRLVSQFLGASDVTNSVSPEELADKFAGSLNTLFDTVNRIISVINVTLLGESLELETIRKVISSNIKGETDYASIKEYLDRIQKAFLVAHKSFQMSATTVLKEVLEELDPKSLASAKISSLKFGPLRKAELYDLYEEKYDQCKRWFDSEQFIDRLLREFEKNCQQSFNAPVR